MTNPLVSISCLSYNAERWIVDTLDSFMIQKTNFPFEVLVHDDASTDGTHGILKEYERKFPGVFKIVIQPKNIFSKTGVYPFFENLKRAKGKYIADCDAEDFWTDPYKLQKQVDFLEANPDYVLSHHDYLLKTPKGDCRPCSLNIQPKDYTKEEMIDYPLSGYGIGLRTRMYRNLYSHKTAKDIEKMCGDYSWVVYLGLFGKCKYHSDITPAIYRYGWGNNSWADLPKDVEQQKIKKMMLDIYEWFVSIGDTNNASIRRKYTLNVNPELQPKRPPQPIVKRPTRPVIHQGRVLPPNWR